MGENDIIGIQKVLQVYHVKPSIDSKVKDDQLWSI